MGVVDDLTGSTSHARPDSVFITMHEQSLHAQQAAVASRETWGSWRLKLAKVMESQNFDLAMGAVIAVNVALIWIETDQGAQCYETHDCVDKWITPVNNTLLGIYTLEAVARLYLYRLVFFRSFANVLDGSVVLFGYLEKVLEGTAVPNLQMLRLVRVLRLMRAIRILRTFPELYLMIRGFASAMMALFWGFVLISFCLVLWSIMAVELIHPWNSKLQHDSDWCMKAFSSVVYSTLLFFQTLVAGDSWGSCAVPIILEYPFLAFIFAGALTTVQLGFTNLILSVIVDSASASREADRDQKKKEQQKLEHDACEEFLDVLKKIDEDGSEEISYSELLRGYETDPQMQAVLQCLNIDKRDLQTFFELIDLDESGQVSYYEFVAGVQRAQTQDLRMQMMILRLQTAQIFKKLRGEVAVVSEEQRKIKMRHLGSLVLDSSVLPGVDESRTSDGTSFVDNAVRHSNLDGSQSTQVNTLGDDAPMKQSSSSQSTGRQTHSLGQSHIRVIGELQQTRHFVEDRISALMREIAAIAAEQKAALDVLAMQQREFLGLFDPRTGQTASYFQGAPSVPLSASPPVVPKLASLQGDPAFAMARSLNWRTPALGDEEGDFTEFPDEDHTISARRGSYPACCSTWDPSLSGTAGDMWKRSYDT